MKVQDTSRRGSLWPFRPWEVYALLVLAVLAAVFFIVFGLLKRGDFGLVAPGVVWLLLLVFWVYRFRHLLLRRRTGSVESGRSPSRSDA
jgi:O-antigen/teichoic acid export membrane protein